MKKQLCHLFSHHIDLNHNRYSKKVCGYAACYIILEKYDTYLGKLIEPYVHEGSICKYIHYSVAEQVGLFLVMEFSPEMCSGQVKDNMSISDPIGFILFMASGIDELPIGFKET